MLGLKAREVTGETKKKMHNGKFNNLYIYHIELSDQSSVHELGCM